MNREPIYAALFGLLSGAAGFITVSRKLRHWSDVSPAEQPALFMVQKAERAEPVRGQPTRWTLSVDAIIYANTAGSAAPAQVINPLIDKLVAALAPNSPINHSQTLGDLVHHCWIEGQIETDEGALGDQAVAIIPIHILVTR